MACNLVSEMFQRIEKLKKNAGVGPRFEFEEHCFESSSKVRAGKESSLSKWCFVSFFTIMLYPISSQLLI